MTRNTDTKNQEHRRTAFGQKNSNEAIDLWQLELLAIIAAESRPCRYENGPRLGWPATLFEQGLSAPARTASIEDRSDNQQKASSSLPAIVLQHAADTFVADDLALGPTNFFACQQESLPAIATVVPRPIIASKGTSVAKSGGSLMIDGEGGVLKKMRFEEAEEAVFSAPGGQPPDSRDLSHWCQSRR